MECRLYQEWANAELQEAWIGKKELVCGLGLDVAAYWLQRPQRRRSGSIAACRIIDRVS